VWRGKGSGDGDGGWRFGVVFGVELLDYGGMLVDTRRITLVMGFQVTSAIVKKIPMTAKTSNCGMMKI